MAARGGLKAAVGWPMARFPALARSLILAVAVAASALPSQNAWAFFGLTNFMNPEGTRLFPQSILFPRHPGKPDPRWRSFDWRYIDEQADGSKYRLYFYDDERWAARFVLPRISEQIADISKEFGYTPSRRFSYLLFTSEREFRQANIFFINEGVQGITSTQEATMAIPYWGEAQTFDHISRHELVHQFQVQKIFDLGDRYAQEKMALMPLWFIEGMAEYVSLKGVDAETSVYLRDIALHPDKDRGYEVPGFFDEGGLGFVPTYKVGQAKIDFLEKRFGAGTAQRLLDAAAREIGTREQMTTFRAVVAAKLEKSEEEIEDSWKSYFDLTYRKPYAKLDTKPKEAKRLEAVGDTLDLYDVSPDGKVIAWRDVNPLVGTTYIRVMHLRNPDSKTEAIHDSQPGAMSLYFMRFPVLAISNDWVGYVADTPTGPELEARRILRSEEEGEKPTIELGTPIRIPLKKDGFLQADSLAFSPDGKDLAVIGLDQKGWANIYVYADFARAASGAKIEPRALTQSSYSWKNISWSKTLAGGAPEGAIIASSDRTSSGRYALFKVNPRSGEISELALREENVVQADAADGGITYQYWTSNGSGRERGPQARMLSLSPGTGQPARETLLTDVTTGVNYPKLRGRELFFLLFEQGRYRLYQGAVPARAPSRELEPPPATHAPLEPWKPVLATFPENKVGSYKPFSSSSGIRIDNLAGFLTTGSYGGAAATFSDLMRNYQLTAEFFVLGGISKTSGSVFLTSQKGRATWTLGAYRTFQERLDNIYSDGAIYTYINREFGALGALQYPLGGYSYVDIGLRLAGVNRGDFSNGTLAPAWEAQNPGGEFMAAPIFRLGYDRIQYEAYSGPLRGFGTLLELDTSWYPDRKVLNKRVRADVAQYWQLWGRSVLAFQLIGAAAFGDEFKNSFLVSSEDILRAYPFADSRLYGNYLLAGKTEIRFPVGSLFGFPPLRGIVGADLGTVYVKPGDFFNRAASSTTLGFALNVPPISLQFLFSNPIRTAPGPQDSSVFHFTLRYLYL